jgi:RND family efflux transporter MFP subunit
VVAKSCVGKRLFPFSTGGYRWICGLGIILASAAATAWSEGGAKSAVSTSDSGGAKSTRSISCTDACNVILFEEAVLAFERPGILGAIDVQEGDLVHSGQFVAKLQDDVAKASLAVAEETANSDIDIRYAEVAAEVAQTEVDKMISANKKVPGTVPDVDVQRGRLNAVKTALEVEKARHTRDLNVLKAKEAAAQLATYRLDAPFDGFVSRVHLTKGASVKQGDPVIKLVSTRKLKVEGQVEVRDAALLRPGAKVKVQPILSEGTGNEAGKSFSGKLVFIDVESTALSGTVRVWAEVENVDNLLRAGQTATMTILPSRPE